METSALALLDEPAERGARLIALQRLDELQRQRQRLAAADRDPGTLHDFRVALRRLRSWLRGLKPVLRGSTPQGARRRLRRIARESNIGRDAEVLLTWLDRVLPELPPRGRATARWLRDRFEQQRREAEASLASLLARDFDRTRDRLTRALSEYRLEAHIQHGIRTVPLAGVMAERLRAHAESLRRDLAAVHAADDDAAAHRARIAGKRLRYLLEPIATDVPGILPVIDELRGLQDVLGDLHDAHLWLLILREVVAEHAVDVPSPPSRAGRRDASRSSSRAPVPSHAGLVLLARLAREQAERAYARYRRRWTPKQTASFFRRLDRVLRRLEMRGRPAVEIERKFLLRSLPPDLPRARVRELAQGYLPGTRLVERVRSVREDGRVRYYRTVKTGSGVVRTELEEETTRAIFETLWPLTKGRRVTKRRHAVPEGPLTWEIDEFTDRKLVLAEVELPETSTEVVLPAWLAEVVEREVTGDPAYLNVNLAR
ncbi:MAG TPA: CHAD domain-containing protein [Gemmatimonadaceae bacterium]